MPTWLRRTVGVMTLGGSATGFTVTITQFVGGDYPAFTLLVFAFFLLVFAYGVVAGVLVLENHDRMTTYAFPFWAIQAPVLSSSWITYSLFSGAQLNLLITGEPMIQLVWGAGASFMLVLFQGAPFAIGVNLVAVVVCIVLVKYERPAVDPSPARDPCPEPISDQLDRLASQMPQTVDQ